MKPLKVLSEIKRLLKQRVLVAIIVICALALAGGINYLLLNKNKLEPASQTDQVEDMEDEYPEPEEKETVTETIILDADNMPTTYEEHMAAVEAAKDADEEVKILTYYNASMFSARVKRPEARSLAQETLGLIESAKKENQIYDSFKENLKIIAEGRYSDIKDPSRE